MNSFLTVSGIFLLAAISPGPDLIIVLRQSLLNGRWAGMMTSVGIFCGMLIHVAISLVGLGLIISKSVMAFTVLKFIGGAYLLYLAYKAFTSRGFDIAKEEQKMHMGQRTNPWLTGFMTNALNPKAMLFVLSVFSIILSPNSSLMLKMVYGIWGAFIVMLWFGFVSMILSNNKVKQQFSRASKWIDRIFGVALTALGAKLLLTKI